MNHLRKTFSIMLFLIVVTQSMNLLSIQPLSDILDLPLHAIILNQDYTVSDKLDMMQDLLDSKKVNIDARDRDGKTALNLATYYKKDPAIIEFLVQHGAEVNEPDLFNVTPLHNSIRYEEIPVAKILLAVGADENHKDDDGRTPMDLAQTKKTKDVLGLTN
ncbi:ankyrin repeat domain-containing protein [Candidatus Babeliales bacterium]|nr:ankyrin repeat domain-containing protein [Candidatus Babeliales bacterium]MBP9843947.1 ankyrin repeat domain-containing protein [Candidatus Babeliales bacterium]